MKQDRDETEEGMRKENEMKEGKERERGVGEDEKTKKCIQRARRKKRGKEGR